MLIGGHFLVAQRQPLRFLLPAQSSKPAAERRAIPKLTRGLGNDDKRDWQKPCH
jgi:hypothetical protein